MELYFLLIRPKYFNIKKNKSLALNLNYQQKFLILLFYM